MTHPTLPPIGISGFAGSGKTTAANYLEREYGYTRLHIADPLRGMLWCLLRDFGVPGLEIEAYLTGSRKEEVIPCLGVTSRQAQITLGTEWGRNLIDPDLWARLWERRAYGVSAPMNDSVRFPNEETAIRNRGGFTILIVRPGCEPAAYRNRAWKWLYQNFGVMRGVHASERVDRLNPDYIVHNDGTLDELYSLLNLTMDHISYRKEVCFTQGEPVIVKMPRT